MQTTAMTAVTTIMGGADNVEQALLTLVQKARPEVIGLCTTALTETLGEDLVATVRGLRRKHLALAGVAVVPVATPDFAGSLQDGWAKAVTRMVEELAEGATEKRDGTVNVLAGPSLTPADVEEIAEIVASFGLSPIVLPDLSGSLDGHVPDDFCPTTLGGTKLAAIRALGRAAITLAIGESMRPAAKALARQTGVPFVVFDRLTGLEATDRFLDLLRQLSGREVPSKYRRQRSRLIDAMLDSHFCFGRKRIAIGAEPDLLWTLASLFAEMGAEVRTAVTTTASPLLEQIPAAETLVGDLEDLEARARDCDLLVTNSHGRQASARLGIPLFRVGMAIVDRLGVQHRLLVGYRGTMHLLYEVGNLFLAHGEEHHFRGSAAEAGPRAPGRPDVGRAQEKNVGHGRAPR